MPSGPRRHGKLVRSRYFSAIRLSNGSYLCVNAFRRTRMVVRPRLKELLDLFETPRTARSAVKEFRQRHDVDEQGALDCVAEFLDANFLREGGARAEERVTSEWLSQYFGRDPDEALVAWGRATRPQQNDYWAAPVGRDVEDLRTLPHRATAIVLGACDVQMETDVLRSEARRVGLDLTVLAAFEGDVALAAERSHDFVILGALQARFDMFAADERGAGGRPHEYYLARARALIEAIRSVTQAPILVDNLPVPTCSPLGLADRGVDSHRSRVHRANLGLVELATEFPDVFVVDVDAAFSRVGKRALLDDSIVGFGHLGALGWLRQRAASELRAVHGIFPDLELLSAFGTGEPFEHERALAAEHLAVIVTCLGIGRRKCVVTDLDYTLWPGVLAETGAPFAWTPEISGRSSFVGLYFGLHEALRALASRGILLACASKNDEGVVRRLWKYGPHYSMERLLTLDDFVAHRIGWQEKVDSLQEIARELGIGLDALVFIDDNPVEREKVREYLPEVHVLGDNPFTTRWELLTHPGLQIPRITAEARERSRTTRGKLERDRSARAAVDQEAFLASLELRCFVWRVSDGADLDRVHELVSRTNQFNTTGRRFPRQELAALAQASGGIHVMSVEDRLTDYGLVAACISSGCVVESFVMSCRVIGLGVEDALLRVAVRDIAGGGEAFGRLVATDRNLPARALFRKSGFEPVDDTTWRLPASALLPAPPPHVRVETGPRPAGIAEAP